MSLQDWPKVGQYVDFKDRDQAWQVGLVIFKNEHCLKIRCQGWCQRYDEIIPISEETNLLKNSKIQPFRTQVRGFTGQRRAPSPRQHWKYSRHDHQERLKKLVEFTTSLKERSPQQLTQFLRGQHYFYVDFLMGNIYTELEDLVQVYEYFSKHINLLQIFLRDLLEKGLSATFINQKLQSGEDQLWEKAYYNCYYELIEAMYNIAGLQERLTYFIHGNEDLIKEVVGMYEKHVHYISTLVQNAKLYDSILEVIAHAHKVAVASSSEVKLPFAFYYCLYQLFQIVENIFRLQNLHDKGIETFDLVFQMIKKGVEELEPNDMKQTQIDRELQYIQVNLKFSALRHKRVENLGIFPEQLRMSTCMLLLKCDKLEKKIKGVSKLKEIAEKVIKDELISMSPEMFSEMLLDFKFLDELFVQNEHVELYKKSIQFVGYLYKYEMISVEELCFVWNASVNKHPMIVSPLLQFWIDMTPNIELSDLQLYAGIVIRHFLDARPNSAEFIEFFLELTIAIIISIAKVKDDDEDKATISKLIAEMTNIGYQMLLKTSDQEYFPMLVPKFASIVTESANCEALIEQTFKRLERINEYKVCLQILNEVYISQDRVDIFAPQQVATILIDCLRREGRNLQDVALILSILNCIINTSNKYNLRNSQFRTLWEHFQSSQDEQKALFYGLILPTKALEIEQNLSSHINIGFNYHLKKYILTEILSDEALISYKSISKKQLSITLQLFIEVNLFEGRIERKKLIEGYRFIHRVKSVELSSEAILWRIFEQCEQQEVIFYLNRYITKFYFNLSPLMSLSLKKSRVDDIMGKIITNIKHGNATKNTRLIKHSLWLLKYIFELLKDQDKPYHSAHPNQNPRPYWVKLELHLLNHVYRLEFPENDTISQLKFKIAEKFKLKPGMFKLMARQQGHSEELDYTYKNITVLALRKSIIEIVEPNKEEETISKFVSSFINEDIENLLLNMLENDAIATEVFMVIEEIDLKFDKTMILAQINSILEKEEASKKTVVNIEVYYHLLEIKIYQTIIENEEEFQSLCSSKSFLRILSCMKHPIQQVCQITFLHKLIVLFGKLYKKGLKTALKSLKVQDYLFAAVLQITKFLVDSTHIKQNQKQNSIKIAQHMLNIIECLIESPYLINFFASMPDFPQLLQKLYRSHEVEEIRMYFTEKINTCLSSILSYPPAAFKEEDQKYLLSLFVDNLYFKIKNDELEADAESGENEAVNEFCIVLELIIRNIDPVRFEKTQIIQPIEGHSSSLFEESINFLDSLKLFTCDFHWHSLLAGHLNILASVYRQRPSLITEDIITFVLDYCLALTNDNIAEPLCKKTDQIQQAFKFLYNIFHVNKKTSHIKTTVDRLTSCHQLDFWRSMLQWNINLKQQAKQDFRGLLNPGCICYLNSLLQQLYMIDEFRIAVLELGSSSHMIEEKDGSDEQVEHKAGTESSQVSDQAIMIQSLREIFLKLKLSADNSINPLSFAKTIKTNDKKPLIKINEQMDIDQFASILFEKIERGARSIGSEDFVKSLFGGVYAHEIISKECSHRSQREEEFISISLEVKQNILKSFESLVKTEILDGGNKYHCEKCDRKVKAEKIQTIKQLPPYLILCLKRFEFDYEVDAKIKINQYCQFPHLLNLAQFSQQEIVKNKSGMLNEEEEQKIQPLEYFNYQLRGVVVHTGSADSGHYYSFIHNRNGSWYEFNDQQVLPFDLDRLPEEAFGCRANRYDIKTKNAYLLFYERVAHKPRKDRQEESSILKRQDNKGVVDRILKKNRDLRKYQIVFSEQYEQLVHRIEVNMAQIENNINLQIPWFEFELSFFFLVKARKESLQHFLMFCKAFEKKIISDPNFCLYFLNVFSSPRFIEEFFIYNPIRQKCKFVAYLLEVALERHHHRKRPKISFIKNQYLFRVFACIRAIFIHHSPIAELLMTLRKFLDYLVKEDDYNTIYHIIQHFAFEKIIVYCALNLGFDKKIKAEAEQICLSKQLDIKYLAPVYSYGRKQHATNHSEGWKIVAILLNFSNQLLEKPQLEVEERRDYYLNLVSNLRQCFSQESVEAKIISVIVDTSSQKGIFYFYHALKELKLHLKILPLIEKALKDFESIKFRPFFLYLEYAIVDKDNTLVEKGKILDLIERAYKVNEKFLLETDLIHQWILRLASFDEEFLEVLQGRRTFTQDISDRIQKNPYPSSDLSKRFKHHVTERIINRCLGIVISTEVKEYQTNSIRMKKQFEEINNFTYRTKNEHSSPDDSFSVGEQIEYFDATYMKWRKVTILENNLGFLTLQKDTNEPSQIFMWEDSEKLRKIIPSRTIEPEVSPCSSDLSYEDSQHPQPKKDIE